MDKVNRLRWIPMMVKAYSDARLRQELQRRGVDWQNIEQKDYAASTQTAAAIPDTRGVVKQAARKPNVYKQTTKKNTSSQRRPPNIGSVLREVREARKQMRQLESLKTQLADMQTQMDQRMSELLERLSATERDRQDMRPHPPIGQPDRQNNPFQ